MSDDVKLYGLRMADGRICQESNAVGDSPDGWIRIMGEELVEVEIAPKGTTENLSILLDMRSCQDEIIAALTAERDALRERERMFRNLLSEGLNLVFRVAAPMADIGRYVAFMNDADLWLRMTLIEPEKGGA